MSQSENLKEALHFATPQSVEKVQLCWAFSRFCGKIEQGDKDAGTRKMDRDIIEIVGINSLVPQEHLLRKIDAAVDFSKLYEMVEPLYCEDNGRPSIDPVVLFKMVLIQHVYGLPSLRRTAEEVSGSIYYRWFLGYSLQEEIPVVSKHYAEELMAEVNADREAHGKKPFDDDDEQPPKGGKKPRDNTSKKKLARRKKEKAHTVTKSITDPDCGLFVKGDHKRQFAYEAHTACDKRGFILEAVVTPGNVHDSAAFDQVYKNVTARFPQIERAIGSTEVIPESAPAARRESSVRTPKIV